ncbi:hypothetical protein GGH96_001896 [Coemansia sp. RSA 1972]|nr:hypothetical protein GGH96_001896 [Coemansia sp. RSA 1972]
MRFRTLTGAQRHKLTNALFVAGVVSAIATVTGSNLLGCPAVTRDNRLDDTPIEKPKTKARELDALVEKHYVAGKLQTVSHNATNTK